MIHPGPNVPFLGLSHPQNALSWYFLRDYILNFDATATTARTNTAVGVLLSLVIVFLALFVIVIPSGDVGLSMGIAFITLIVAIFLSFILASGVIIWDEQVKQKHLLRLEVFKTSARFHRNEARGGNRDELESSIAEDSLQHLVTYIDKVDKPLMVLGVVPLRKSTLNAVRGVTLTLLTGTHVFSLVKRSRM